MSQSVEITKSAEVEVCVYDVTDTDGNSYDFELTADDDGDLRIVLSSNPEPTDSQVIEAFCDEDRLKELLRIACVEGTFNAMHIALAELEGREDRSYEWERLLDAVTAIARTKGVVPVSDIVEPVLEKGFYYENDDCLLFVYGMGSLGDTYPARGILYSSVSNSYLTTETFTLMGKRTQTGEVEFCPTTAKPIPADIMYMIENAGAQSAMKLFAYQQPQS